MLLAGVHELRASAPDYVRAETPSAEGDHAMEVLCRRSAADIRALLDALPADVLNGSATEKRRLDRRPSRPKSSSPRRQRGVLWSVASSRSLTMLYRSNTHRVLCPVRIMATRSGTPARMRFLAAVRRQSCKQPSGMPASLHARRHATFHCRTVTPSRLNTRTSPSLRRVVRRSRTSSSGFESGRSRPTFVFDRIGSSWTTFPATSTSFHVNSVTSRFRHPE